MIHPAGRKKSVSQWLTTLFMCNTLHDLVHLDCVARRNLLEVWPIDLRQTRSDPETVTRAVEASFVGSQLERKLLTRPLTGIFHLPADTLATYRKAI